MRSKILALLTVLMAVAMSACSTGYTVLDTITPAPEVESFIPEEQDEGEGEIPVADARDEDFVSMPAYVPGTYRGEGDGYGGTLEVDVTVDEYGITDVTIVSHNEDPKVAGEALTALPEAIMQAQSADVDAVSGATMTSDAIVSAVMNALGLAMVQ
ncbi:MAG: FMN-binding protein [Christensenellales bacterium]|jgi:uncharacterized protein with FMN-binding domain